MSNTKSETTKVVRNVRWDDAGDVTDSNFVAEQFVPNLHRIIEDVQKDIWKVIYRAIYTKAKTAGKFNRIVISVNVTPEVELQNFILKPEESRG